MVATSDNNTQQEDSHATEKSSIEDFEEYFSKNQTLTNVELYEKFPDVNKSTLRSWKNRTIKKLDAAHEETTTHATVQRKNEEFWKPQVETLKNLLRGKFNETLLSSLPIEYQHQQLTLIANTINDTPDPNMSAIPTPTGRAKPKRGIEKYLTIDEKAFRDSGKGTVRIMIPASKFANPEFADKLTKKK